jgi:hypothetical protein
MIFCYKKSQAQIWYGAHRPAFGSHVSQINRWPVPWVFR